MNHFRNFWGKIPKFDIYEHPLIKTQFFKMNEVFIERGSSAIIIQIIIYINKVTVRLFVCVSPHFPIKQPMNATLIKRLCSIRE